MNGAPETVDWLPAVVILAVGIVAGAVIAWRALLAARRAKRKEMGAVPAPLRDLEGKRDALVLQLQELEDTASKRTPAQLAQERYRLELDAARILLALDASGAAPRVAARALEEKRAPVETPAPRTALRGFLWGMASTAAVLLLAFFVYVSAKPRGSGDSVTGNLPAREAADTVPATGEEAELKARIARNPNDIEAHLALARFALDKPDYMTVWNETTGILEREPANARALSYQAVVRLAMGQTAVAAEMLQKSMASDPDFVDTHAYLALAYARMGRMPAARKAIADASRRFPDRADDLQRFLTGLQNEKPAPGEPAQATGGDPHAGLAVPAAGATAPGARRGAQAQTSKTSAPAGRRVAGIIELEPALQKGAAPGGILFVYARSARATGGPPIAVKRLPAVFPAAFELGEADSMMGQPFPDRLLIEARLDADGDPTTRDPSDPKARADDVKAGRTDLHLVLKRP